MMDISLSGIAPRAVADLRPAADAAATARIDRPPPAVTPAPPLAPVSLTQEALVARNVLEPSAVEGTEPSTTTVHRVLKPWGVPMLPWDEPARETPRGDADGTAGDPATEAADGSPDRTRMTGVDLGTSGTNPAD